MHKSQDALLDRLITIYMDHYDRATELAITVASGGVSREMAEQILELVYLVRQRDPTGQRPSIRAAIMLAKVLTCQRPRLRPARSAGGEHLPRRAAPGQSVRPEQDAHALQRGVARRARCGLGRPRERGACRMPGRPPRRRSGPRRCWHEEQGSQGFARHRHPRQR